MTRAPATPAEIAARIDWLEQRLHDLEGLSWYSDRQKARAVCDSIAAAVRALPDARLKTDWDGARLTMLGITTSCTGGEPGVYTHWIRRARDAAARDVAR